jgi:hypothetical protein
MLARLGNVLYWLGCIVAALVFVSGEAFMSIIADSPRTTLFDYVVIFGVVGIIAIIIWLIGRACRYVLAGT